MIFQVIIAAMYLYLLYCIASIFFWAVGMILKVLGIEK